MSEPILDKASGSAGEQVLTFRLGGETYGVDILQVKEIRGWTPVTRIPHSPPHMLGVLNLRGAVVPVMDLRVRFGLPSAQFTAETVIAVLSIATPAGKVECGLVVDAVSDVADLQTDAIQPVSSLNASASARFIRGVCTVGAQMLILLDAALLVANGLEVAEDQAAAA